MDILLLRNLIDIAYPAWAQRINTHFDFDDLLVLRFLQLIAFCFPLMLSNLSSCFLIFSLAFSLSAAAASFFLVYSEFILQGSLDISEVFCGI